jgi:hypothetical protein
MPRLSSVRKSPSRVYRYQVKRQLEESLTLPSIQQHGFTHPQHGFFVMLPREFDAVLAFESKPVAQVILEVLRQTVGKPGDGPGDRGHWAALSYGHFARTGHMNRSTAERALKKAVDKGYLLRRRRNREFDYAIKWKNLN